MTSVLPDYRSPLYLGDGRLLASDGDGRLVTLRINLDDGAVVESPAVQLEGLALSSGFAGAYSLADDGTFVYLAGPATTEHIEFLSWLSPDGDVEPFSERGTQYQIDTFPSPDGTRVAAEFVSGDNVTVHIHDIARDVSTPLLPGSYSTFPVWSPDSQSVAYFLRDGDAPGIYSAPVDRSELPRLLLAKPEDSFVLPMDWSPDGTTLIYVVSGDEFRSTNVELNDLWLLPVDGSEPRPLVQTAAREVDGRFSPDGRWFTYVSDQSGERQIYVRSMDGGGEYQISAQGGYSPEWNPQGGELYFMWEGQIYVVDIDVSGATPEVSPERLLVSLRSSRFKGDLYAPWPDGERFLVATHPQGEEARTLQAIFNWELMRDDR
jgi:dipeptidyl aminopeptidase/acylaminoacyl peptidase